MSRPERPPAPAGVLGPIRTPFRAIATTVVPEAASLDAPQWREVEALIEHALAGRPPALRRQIALFVRLLELLPALRYGRRLSRLPPGRRAAFLHGLEVARIDLVRKGFWGVRTLILLGYYGRAGAAEEIGYHADPRGWEARA